jgi:hypothetical protein
MSQHIGIGVGIALQELGRIHGTELRPRRVDGIHRGFLTAVVAASVSAAVLLATAAAPRTTPVDTTGPQRMIVIGSNDPARIEALDRSLCVHESPSRYPDPNCHFSR